MKFKGKISPWWRALTGVFNVIVLFGIYVTGLSVAVIPFIFLLVVPDLFFIPVLRKNEVTVDKKEVLIQFGLLRKRIPVKEITILKAVESMSTSYAASSDRIEITTKTLTSPVYVSLETPREFVQEVRKYNHKIKYMIG